MIRLLQLLIFGHFHKWKIMHRCPVYERGEVKPVRFDYDCQCETCGKVRVFRC